MKVRKYKLRVMWKNCAYHYGWTYWRFNAKWKDYQL